MIAIEVGFLALPALLLGPLRPVVTGGLLSGYIEWSDIDWQATTRGDHVDSGVGGRCWVLVGSGVWFVGEDPTTRLISWVMTRRIPIMSTAVSWTASL